MSTLLVLTRLRFRQKYVLVASEGRLLCRDAGDKKLALLSSDYGSLQ